MTSETDPIQDAGRIIRGKAVAAAWTGGYIALGLRQWYDNRSGKKSKDKTEKEIQPPHAAASTDDAVGGRKRARPHPGRPIYLALSGSPATGGELVPTVGPIRDMVINHERGLRHDTNLADRLAKDWSLHAQRVTSCTGWDGLADRLLKLQRMGLDPVQVMRDLPIRWPHVKQPATVASMVIDEQIRSWVERSRAHQAIVPYWRAGQSYATSSWVARPHPGPKPAPTVPLPAKAPIAAIEA